MFTLVLIIHILACLSLIGLILIQQGRGGGLVDSFSGVESMFGTKTSTFLTRATTILASLFIVTCLSLAFMSTQRNKSVLERVKMKTPATQKPLPINQTTIPTTTPITVEQKTEPVTTPIVPVEAPKPAVKQTPVSVLPGQNQTTTP